MNKPYQSNLGQAAFTLTVEYTRESGKGKRTFRDDVTLQQYLNVGMPDVEQLHPLHVLYLKYLEERHVVASAILWDNSKPRGAEQILMKKGWIGTIERDFAADRRSEYYNINTGKPWPPKAKPPP